MNCNPTILPTSATRSVTETYDNDIQRERTALLVEDEPSVREVLSQFLRALGFRVLEAMNGQQALDIVAEHDGTIALVLTDEVMPSIGGSDLLNRIRAAFPEVRGILMSGYLERDGKAFVSESDRCFLQKPFTLINLRNAVEQVFCASPRAVTLTAHPAA